MSQDTSLIIAVDGYASSGKSTLAKDLAQELQYSYIDTGAMYRAVTLYFLRHEIDWTDAGQRAIHLKKIDIEFRPDEQTGESETYLNDHHVEEEIRSMKVSKHVSNVSTIKEVRQFLVQQQRNMGKKGGVIMDGRDIGTVVFPNAHLKLFVTADFEVRVQRRCQQMKQNGIEYSEEEVRQNLKERDYQDTHREESPLRKADDAVEIDNTHLSPEEQLEKALELAKERMNS